MEFDSKDYAVHATIRQRENLQKMEQKLRAEEERLMQQVDTQCLPSNLQENQILKQEKRSSHKKNTRNVIQRKGGHYIFKRGLNDENIT